MPGDQVVTAMPRAGRTHGGDVDTSRHEWYESACSGRAVGGSGARPAVAEAAAGRAVCTSPARRGSARRARHMGRTLSSVAAGVVGQLMRVGMWTWEDREWR